MKKEKSKYSAKLTHKKGISLIVLIVTIIVVIILSAIVILTLNENNLIESAKEATFKEDIRSFQDELTLTLSKEYIDLQGQRDYKFNATKLEEIQKYIPSFSKKYEGKVVIKNDELVYQETVTEKEKKWFEDLGIKEKGKTAAQKVYEDPSYYGKSITNYSANGVTGWKIFHSDGKNVYIIASDYVDVDKLPTTVAGHKPENINSNYPKAAQFNNVISDYTGSVNITDEKIIALNNDYFNEKGYTSTSDTMKAVAYMLDTEIWSSFKTEKAEYAVGGPTVEMLMASYSKAHDVDYRARAKSSIGYEISKDGGVSWANAYDKMLSTSDSLYVIISTTNAAVMWLASPSASGADVVLNVNYGGGVGNNGYGNTDIGFRPIICLKSDILLEVDGDGYKIK